MALKKSAGAALAAIRWANATESDRERSRENGRLGGRPRTKAKRCACGALTAKTAKARGHRCTEGKIDQVLAASKRDGENIRKLLLAAKAHERGAVRLRKVAFSAAAAILGRRGGTSRSQAKAEACRQNGALGGRPRTKAKRCACGAMTAKRAKARGHRCGA